MVGIIQVSEYTKFPRMRMNLCTIFLVILISYSNQKWIIFGSRCNARVRT